MVLQLVSLAAGFFLGFPLALLLHEAGHVFPALVLTKQRIEVTLGRQGTERRLDAGRLNFIFRGSYWTQGQTRYDRSLVSRGRQLWVIAGGPLASLAWGILLALDLYWSARNPFWFMLLGAWVANLRLFVVSVWPIAYRPDGVGGPVWLSDSLDFWKMVRGRD